jgi:hypothetical protein
MREKKREQKKRKTNERTEFKALTVEAKMRGSALPERPEAAPPPRLGEVVLPETEPEAPPYQKESRLHEKRANISR